MLQQAKDAIETLIKFESQVKFGTSEISKSQQEVALQRRNYNEMNLQVERVVMIDGASPEEGSGYYGIDTSERLFWEAYAMKQDCSRPKETEWYINREFSTIHSMNGNFKSTRQYFHQHPNNNNNNSRRRVVVYQKQQNNENNNPMEPRTLLVAYEENGTVLPVVSDFDLFLLGSRRMDFSNCEISKDQVESSQWLVHNIRDLLLHKKEQQLQQQQQQQQEQDSDGTKRGISIQNWSESWQDVIRRSAILDGYYPETPPYGHSDPVSYAVIQQAAERLKKTGCVRHGPKCFNWHFPQEIDDQFLVICDVLPGTSIPWKYMTVHQLQELLIDMIDDGFTFPINPKWILCDPGWKRVYDKLKASTMPNVQESLNCWSPPSTGIREEIDKISKEYPCYSSPTAGKNEDEGLETTTNNNVWCPRCSCCQHWQMQLGCRVGKGQKEIIILIAGRLIPPGKDATVVHDSNNQRRRGQLGRGQDHSNEKT